MSTSRPMTLREFRSYVKELPRELENAVVRGIQAGALRGVALAVSAGDNAVPASEYGSKGAFDTGSYRRGWRARNVRDGAVVENVSKQADIIERGRRPGRRPPPSSIIIPWAKRRLGLSAKEAKRAAYPIAMAIGRRGLRARRVLELATPEIVRVVIEEVKREVALALSGGHR